MLKKKNDSFPHKKLQLLGLDILGYPIIHRRNNSINKRNNKNTRTYIICIASIIYTGMCDLMLFYLIFIETIVFAVVFGGFEKL